MAKVTKQLKARKPTKDELIYSARVFVEQHLSGGLTPLQLQKKLGTFGLNYTKINRPNQTSLIFVIRGAGIERTELKF